MQLKEKKKKESKSSNACKDYSAKKDKVDTIPTKRAIEKNASPNSTKTNKEKESIPKATAKKNKAPKAPKPQKEPKKAKAPKNTNNTINLTNSATTQNQFPLSYQPLSYQPLSYQPLSYQPLSYQPLSHQPLSFNSNNNLPQKSRADLLREQDRKKMEQFMKDYQK